MDSHIRLRLVDGSIIKEPGKTGSQWRLDFSFILPEFRCDYFQISPSKGEGTGETFRHSPVQAGDHMMGDRGYSNAQGISSLAAHQAYVLVRVNTGALALFDEHKQPFALAESIHAIEPPFESREWPVVVKEPTGPAVTGRLCVLRKSEQAIEQAQQKLKAQARKKQKRLKPETLEYAKYVRAFSTFPKTIFTTEQRLEWYRIRWQVELAFKRLKTLLDMGHLPKYDPSSSRAWL